MRARNIWGLKYLWTTKGHASNCYIITKIYLFISEKTKEFLLSESGKRGALRYALQVGESHPALRYTLQTTPYFRSAEGGILHSKYKL